MTSPNGSTARLGAIAAAFALVLAACGGGTADDPAETTIAPVTTEAAVTTTLSATTDAPETTTTLPTLDVTSTTTAAAPSSEAGAALTQAMNQTAAVTSARYEGEMRITGVEDPTLAIDEFTMGFSGAYTAEGSFSMIMDLSSLAEVAGEDLGGFEDLFGAMEIRVVDGVGYMSMPLFTMFTGYEWVQFPEDESGELTEGFTGGANPSNPSDFLTAMKDADAEVVEIGRELVRDVETTHYSATVNVAKLTENATPEERAEIEAQIGASGIEELPFDVWIGDDGILRRYQFAISGADMEPAAGGGEFESMVMIMEMFDIGTEVVIEAPPAEDVAPEDALVDLFGFAEGFGDLEG